METAPEISDIDAIFKKSDGQISLLGTSDTTPNKLALEEVIQVIGLNNARHMKTSLKALLDKFAAAPYMDSFIKSQEINEKDESKQFEI